MLRGKTAVITGGGSGIGRAIALKMAENGADIAVIDAGDPLKTEAVCKQATENGGKALAFRCDVTNFDETKQTISAIIKELGGVDILVNNAGITRDGLIFNMKEAEWSAVLDTNLKGAFHMIRHCYANFLKKKSGKIINISSVSGLMGNAGQANYSASKSGLIGLTKSVARELAGRNVCCNAIAPGFIDTEMTRALGSGEALTDAIPLKRMGSPEDVADLAVFLASSMADYITGEVIRVDGGLAM